MHVRWLLASTITVPYAAGTVQLPADGEQLIYSKHVEDDYWNVREKLASCWSLLRKYITNYGTQNVKCQIELDMGIGTAKIVTANIYRNTLSKNNHTRHDKTLVNK